MEIISKLRTDLWNVALTQDEVDEIENYVDLDEADIEVWAGENTLETNTLLTIYNRLNSLTYHNKTTFELTQKLEEFCMQNVR
jgi:hypothetical protein